MADLSVEQTSVLVKPDALKNSLTGYVLSQLSGFHTGLWFAGAKIVYVSPFLAEEHYAEHRQKAIFPSLLDYLMGADELTFSGPGCQGCGAQESSLSEVVAAKYTARVVLLHRGSNVIAGIGGISSSRGIHYSTVQNLGQCARRCTSRAL